MSSDFRLEIVYYLGVIGLISAVVAIMIQKFREYEEIDLDEHITMITIYLILLVFAIILWRIIFNFFYGITDILNHNNFNYENIIKGDK
jgi:uncharacterized protein HemY